MPEVDFNPLPADYQELISALRQRIAHCEKYVVDFEHRHYNGMRENAVIYCLRHAIDLAKGCLATSLEELPDSITTLSRALLETLFWARYISLSQENSQEFVDSTVNEMKRLSRKNLNAGYAKIYDIRTKDDKSKELLNSPFFMEIPTRPNIEKAAELGGLERVYTNIYGFISMIAHGRAFNLRTKSNNIIDELYGSVRVALGALQCIEIITADWIIHRKQTSIETLNEILGV